MESRYISSEGSKQLVAAHHNYMRKQIQKQAVIDQLKQYGMVTRNWALNRCISRLSALICQLNKEGWNLEGRNQATSYGTNDYVYRVVKKKEDKPVTFNNKSELEVLQQIDKDFFTV